MTQENTEGTKLLSSEEFEYKISQLAGHNSVAEKKFASSAVLVCIFNSWLKLPNECI